MALHVQDCSTCISSALAVEILQYLTKPSIWCTQIVNNNSYSTLLSWYRYTNTCWICTENNVWKKTIWLYGIHVYRWYSVRLWYLQCISTGDTTVLYWAITSCGLIWHSYVRFGVYKLIFHPCASIWSSWFHTDHSLNLTHWDLNKMADILQKTSSDTCSWFEKFGI